MFLLAINAEFLFISSSCTVFNRLKSVSQIFSRASGDLSTPLMACWSKYVSIERGNLSIKNFPGTAKLSFEAMAFSPNGETWHPRFRITGISFKVEPPATLLSQKEDQFIRSFDRQNTSL